MLLDRLLQEDGMPAYRRALAKKLEAEPALMLFGAGVRGQYTYRWMQEHVQGLANKEVCFLDNDPAKQGTLLLGRKVVLPAKAVPDTNALIVITTGDAEDVIEQLRGLRGGRPCRFLVPDIDDTPDDFAYLHTHQSELELVYNMLEDERSRHVFVNLLNYRLGHDGNLLEQASDPCERQYFDSGLIHFADDDVFVDCGSFIGDTVDAYLGFNDGHYGKVYAIEADCKNFGFIASRYRDNSRIKCINRGVWYEKAELCFDPASNSGGSVVFEDTTVTGGTKSRESTIQVDTVDHIVGQDHVTFLKMDIEGAEVPALLGSYHTIVRERPTLMICVYHRQDDFIRIPLLIKSFCPEYRLYFRHYRKYSIQETVCYAIADERRKR